MPFSLALIVQGLLTCAVYAAMYYSLWLAFFVALMSPADRVRAKQDPSVPTESGLAAVDILNSPAVAVTLSAFCALASLVLVDLLPW